jgi:hypothetical protein
MQGCSRVILLASNLDLPISFLLHKSSEILVTIKVKWEINLANKPFTIWSLKILIILIFITSSVQPHFSHMKLRLSHSFKLVCLWSVCALRRNTFTLLVLMANIHSSFKIQPSIFLILPFILSDQIRLWLILDPPCTQTLTMLITNYISDIFTYPLLK